MRSPLVFPNLSRTIKAEVCGRSLRTPSVHRVEGAHLASPAGSRTMGRNLWFLATTRTSKCKNKFLVLDVTRSNGDNNKRRGIKATDVDGVLILVSTPQARPS